MGQTGSSYGRRKTLFGRDFDKFEGRVREDSDYVTLVRVIPSQNDLTTSTSSTSSTSITDRRISRANTIQPIRPKTTLEPNIYSDLRQYLRPKSTFNIPNENPSDEDLAEISYGFSNNDITRPVSYSNHCSSRCVCSQCRLTRYHLLNWLLPNCTRTNAERLLLGRPEGTFLIRYS
jgi:hypothetical protein